MNDIFTVDDLDPFLTPQLRDDRAHMERATKAQCSEHVIMQVHDAVYSTVKAATAQVHDSLGAAVGEISGSSPVSSLWRQPGRDIARLRILLDDDAKERVLQDTLVELCKVAMNCEVSEEVPMRRAGRYVGMRMDIVLSSKTEEPSQIIELKRGSHRLVAWPEQPKEKISRKGSKAVKQLKEYGNRIASDADTARDLENLHGIRFDNVELRLIAGRRLSTASEYDLLSAAETANSVDGPRLLIYSWDASLAELERIHD
jgi:hypothetical protein